VCIISTPCLLAAPFKGMWRDPFSGNTRHSCCSPCRIGLCQCCLCHGSQLHCHGSNLTTIVRHDRTIFLCWPTCPRCEHCLYRILGGSKGSRVDPDKGRQHKMIWTTQLVSPTLWIGKEASVALVNPNLDSYLRNISYLLPRFYIPSLTVGNLEVLNCYSYGRVH
jgi:hypothetical protein